MEKEIPKKEYYTVEVETLVPTVLKYKVYATSPEEALSKYSTAPLIESPKQKFAGMKKIQAKVFKFGTHLLKYSKNF